MSDADHLRGDYPDGVGAFERTTRAIAAWVDTEELADDVEQVALILWSGMHGVACLILDGALRLVDGTLDELVAGVTR